MRATITILILVLLSIVCVASRSVYIPPLAIQTIRLPVSIRNGISVRGGFGDDHGDDDDHDDEPLSRRPPSSRSSKRGSSQQRRGPPPSKRGPHPRRRKPGPSTLETVASLAKKTIDLTTSAAWGTIKGSGKAAFYLVSPKYVSREESWGIWRFDQQGK
jgi:hypothetical protein